MNILFSLLTCLALNCSATTINNNTLPNGNQSGNQPLQSLPPNKTVMDMITPLIVGGEEAKRNEFPWLVHLYDTYSRSSFCGGALIRRDLVVTAAHCTKAEGITPSRVLVVAGDHDLRSDEGTEQNSTVKSFKWHEKYDEDQYINDIALIKLTKNLTITAAVRPINLPAANFDFRRAINGTVAGWGTMIEGGSQSRYLRKVTVPLVTGSTCASLLTHASSQFCAGTSGKDSCQGDSGGPFICKNAPGTICGIVSYGFGCGRPGYPGVYQNVPYYVSWINKNRGFSLSASSHNVLIAVPSVFLLVMRIMN